MQTLPHADDAGKRPAQFKTPAYPNPKTPVKTPSKKKLKPLEAATEMIGKLVEHHTKNVGGYGDMSVNRTVDRASKHFSEMFTHLTVRERMIIKKVLRNKDNAKLYLTFDEEKVEYVESEMQN